MEGIRFIRHLISFEAGTLEDGRPDPGWCCSDHARVASLAYCILGVQAERCRGKLFIGSIPRRLVLDVHPHDFVLVKTPAGLTDTSISFDAINGIPVGHRNFYPELGVALFNAKPTQEDWKTEAAKQDKPYFALYAIQFKELPNEATLKHQSSTPFGKWLTELLGSQNGIWGKAAWFAAEFYAGRTPVDYSGLDRESLWKRINSSPDRDKFVLDRLAVLNANGI